MNAACILAWFGGARWPLSKNKSQERSDPSQPPSEPVPMKNSQQSSRWKRSKAYAANVPKEPPESVSSKYPPRSSTSASSQGNRNEINTERDAGVPRQSVDERRQTQHQLPQIQIRQQDQPQPADERQDIGMHDEGFVSNTTGFISEVSASPAPDRSAQVAMRPVPLQELAENQQENGHLPQDQGEYRPNTYQPPAREEHSINVVVLSSQNHPPGDPRQDIPRSLVPGSGGFSEKKHPPPRSHDDPHALPRPHPDNGQPGAWKQGAEKQGDDSQNRSPDTACQNHHGKRNEWQGANKEASDPYLYAGAAGPRLLGLDAAHTQNTLAIRTVTQSESHSTAFGSEQAPKQKVLSKLSRISDAPAQKVTEGYHKLVGRRSSNPGALKPMQPKPEPEAHPALPTHAEVTLRDIETRIYELLRQRANRILPKIPPRGPVIETFLDWVPRELDVWKTDISSLHGKITVLEGKVRTATQTARDEGDNARKAEAERNQWKSRYDATARDADELRTRLNKEENNSAHVRQELHKVNGEVTRLNGSFQEIESANWGLRSEIHQTTKSLHEQRATVQWLNKQLQEADTTYKNDLALLNEELDLEKESRETDRQAHSEQLASQRSDFQQQKEQEEKKHKQIVRKQRQVIASHDVENYRPIGDDTFQLSFQTIAQTIGNLLVLVPQPSNPGNGAAAEIDSTGFLARRMSVRLNGDSRPRGGGVQAWPRFFRSVCWRILVEGFFQDQPGFGVFGPEGEGYELLKGLREVFMQTTADGLTGEQPGLSDKESNSWRASFFAALLKEIRSQPSSSALKKLPALFHRNVEIVTSKLVDTMQGISGGRLDPRGPAWLSSLARDAGMLALEMGAQRARLTLELARVGEKASGGGSNAWYRDEGGREVGEEVTVDLATQPCLRKIGDGRSDTRSENIIVKGEIVSY